jgi:hypothetical protein
MLEELSAMHVWWNACTACLEDWLHCMPEVLHALPAWRTACPACPKDCLPCVSEGLPALQICLHYMSEGLPAWLHRMLEGLPALYAWNVALPALLKNSQQDLPCTANNFRFMYSQETFTLASFSNIKKIFTVRNVFKMDIYI